MKYEDYLKTDYWKAVSDAVKKRADYRCQVCNSPHDLCAHHRTYEHRGRELDHLSDLICLCRRCHEIFHGKVKKPTAPKYKPTIFDGSLGPGLSARIDAAMLKSFQTESGGYSNATLNALGINSSEKGWKRRVIGSVITLSQFNRAREGRNILGTKRRV